jgi:hypothetical protein
MPQCIERRSSRSNGAPSPRSRVAGDRFEGEIPGLLKQLAVLRHEANNKKREENRTGLVDAVQNLNNSAH